jgi:hypothetical protein
VREREEQVRKDAIKHVNENKTTREYKNIFECGVAVPSTVAIRSGE